MANSNEKAVSRNIADIKVNVDAGHGSNTAGKRTAPFTKDVDIDGDGKVDVKKGKQYSEHYANVMVANKLYNKLKSRGFGVHRTGWNDTNAKDDEDVTIADRQKSVRNAKCDLSISCHFNAYGDGNSYNTANGIGIYIHSTKSNLIDSERFANVLLNQLVKGTKQKNRGVNAGNFGMCNAKNMGVQGAVIVELAFMTNEYEAQELMASEKYCEECAEELFKGVCDYYGVDYKKEIVEDKKVDSPSTQPTNQSSNEYLVKVTASALNIRKAASMDAVVTGIIRDKGVYTIVETSKNGKWGKLKSGAGWISLSYTKKL